MTVVVSKDVEVNAVVHIAGNDAAAAIAAVNATETNIVVKVTAPGYDSGSASVKEIGLELANGVYSPSSDTSHKTHAED